MGNFPQHFPQNFRQDFLQDFSAAFPARFSHKIFPQDFAELDPDWLAPHHPIPNAKFPPITAFLKLAFSPPPCPTIFSHKIFSQDFPTRICFYLLPNSPSGPPWNEGHRPKVRHETSVFEVPVQEQHEHSFYSSSTNTFITGSLYTVRGCRTSPGAPDLWARLG